MAMLAKKVQPSKTKAIEATKTEFSKYSDFVFADYRGLTVEQITNLRKKLREQNATLKVVKNNFAKIAFDEMKVTGVADYLKGPTAIACAKEDSNVVAKTLFDFMKDAPTLAVKGAFVDNAVLDKAKIEAYSKVPGRKQLIAMLMSAMNGPVQKLTATIQAYADKLAAEGPAKPAASSAPAASTADAPKAEAKPADAPKADAKPAEAAKA